MSLTCQVQVVAFENDAHELRRCLGSAGAALEHARRAGVLADASVVVGDCSPAAEPDADRGLDALVAPARLSWATFGENLASSGGNNRLAAGATADVLVLLNPDAYVAPPTLTMLLERLEREPAVGIAEARQIPFDLPKAFDPHTGDTEWAAAACVAVRRQVFESLDGFDEALPLHGNDVDLSWRARLAGWRVVYEPRAVVFHDRRFDTDAVARHSSTAAEHEALASLVLAHKYRRPDALAAAIARIERDADADELRGLEAFRSRQRDGALPAPVDDPDGLATFDGRAFAVHRF